MASIGDPKTSVIHIAVSEDDRRKMAQRALAEGRPLSNWCRMQLLKAFEPAVHDEGPIGDAYARRSAR
jgi:hypothetical protein